jgi:uncharacterized membrane protein YidH (DUF202 family)
VIDQAKAVSARAPPFDSTPRLRRTIVLCVICLCASALGMMLAHPIAAQFHRSSPWILPVIAVGVLVILVIVALLVLPRLTARRP